MKLSAPGKLMIAGEWTVLEGHACIVAAVNKRVCAEIAENGEISVSIDNFKIKDVKAVYANNTLDWINADGEQAKKLVFTKAAIEAALQYLEQRKPFKLRTWGEKSQTKTGSETKKIGFGSSAAAVVAVVGAILAFHGIDVNKNRNVIYKLSAIAHYFAQGKIGSAFDIAASVYGGIIAYNRFDSAWLSEQFESNKSVRDIIAMEWPGFRAEKINTPKDFILLVCWTKGSASTTAMIKQMNLFREKNPGKYEMIYDNIGKLTDELVRVWKKEDGREITELLRSNENLLRELGAESGVNIETPELKKLSDIANNAGAAGKLSGAGGGDCGIAICFDEKTAKKIKDGWKAAGLYPIDVDIDKEGVKLE